MISFMEYAPSFFYKLWLKRWDDIVNSKTKVVLAIKVNSRLCNGWHMWWQCWVCTCCICTKGGTLNKCTIMCTQKKRVQHFCMCIYTGLEGQTMYRHMDEEKRKTHCTQAHASQSGSVQIKLEMPPNQFRIRPHIDVIYSSDIRQTTTLPVHQHSHCMDWLPDVIVSLPKLKTN